MTGERDRRYEQLKRRYEALEGRFQQVLAELRSRMTCELVDEVGGVAKLAATCGMDELRVCELMAGERPSALECLLLIAAAQQALEPLTRIASTCRCTVLGIIHLNKGQSGDPLKSVMGSVAFTAASRFVLFCMVDPDDKAVRLIGEPKNNTGRSDLPTMAFTIEEVDLGVDGDGQASLPTTFTFRRRWLLRTRTCRS